MTAQLCWGRNDEGQCDSPEGLLQVAAGANHSIAIRFDGTIACWGLNDQANVISERRLYEGRGWEDHIGTQRRRHCVVLGTRTLKINAIHQLEYSSKSGAVNTIHLVFDKTVPLHVGDGTITVNVTLLLATGNATGRRSQALTWNP